MEIGGNAGSLDISDINFTPPALPNLSINDFSQLEGNAGNTTFTFTVTLNAPAPAGGVTFDIVTQDNTATTANSDYVALSLSSQTIAAGISSYSFSVTVNGDVNYEPDETFNVNVTNVINAVVTDGQGVGIIINDDFNCSLYSSGIAYVNVNAGGANDGSTWDNAFASLQDALAAASTCPSVAQIWVAQGTYKPGGNANADRTISFAMKNGVAIYGGFANTGNPTFAERNPAGFPTTLSGDLQGNDGPDFANNGENSYNVILNPVGLDNTAMLDGFVITSGNANGNNFPYFFGGGIYNEGRGSGNVCSPTIRNCVFQGNYAFLGGAMYNEGNRSGTSSPVLTNCSFQGNTASYGGAMYNDGKISGTSSPVLTNCSFQGNTAYANGGAMHNDGNISGTSSPVLTNCSLQGNTAFSNGGAMMNYGNYSGVSSPVLTNCSLQGNIATTSGGAMYNSGFNGTSSPLLTNSVFFGNGGSNTFFNGEATGASASYCLFDNTVTGVDVSGPGNLSTTVSPFVSTNSTELRPGSPAINAGLTSANTTQTDLAGNPRVAGSGIDMGAHEFHARPSTSR